MSAYKYEKVSAAAGGQETTPPLDEVKEARRAPD